MLSLGYLNNVSSCGTKCVDIQEPNYLSFDELQTEPTIVVASSSSSFRVWSWPLPIPNFVPKGLKLILKRLHLKTLYIATTLNKGLKAAIYLQSILL